MKTKGALIWDFNQLWSIEEIELGDPVKGEVKIQMEASGMCHSDHHLVTGGIPMAGFPIPACSPAKIIVDNDNITIGRSAARQRARGPHPRVAGLAIRRNEVVRQR